MQSFSLFVQNTYFSFMSNVIHRCIKRPGLIDRARTYYLELNTKGLYILCLGNATQEIPRSGDFVANAIATQAVNFIANQYEKKIRETETQIQTSGIDGVAQEKHSHFLLPSEIENFEFNLLSDNSLRIKIKSGKLKITLFADGYYSRIAQSMKQELNK
jgi:hypothetical protein